MELVIKIFIGDECVETFMTMFEEGVGWQHVAPYALMFVPLVTGPSFPTPPPLPQQGMSIAHMSLVVVYRVLFFVRVHRRVHVWCTFCQYKAAVLAHSCIAIFMYL
jgi:hypothetical protein